MVAKVGDKLPDAAAALKLPDCSDINVDEVFKGKKVVLFAVPGAFTPTCSKTHAPGFIEHAEALKAKGVDTIACVSVNDPFVMDAWAKSLNAGSALLFLADGNGTFTEALGLELDGSGFGLGKRSRRYAMVVDDGVITKLNLEEGGGLTCSAANDVLALL
ncbi:hypothetical protein HT031_004206 [Scenedesmus sp. PABB004]|nr:hypothetical protein HT031_004206 [Scenedesmus sp. PABB004]